MPIQLTENSPSEGHYYASGRGGAGNYRRRSSIFTPASPISIIPSTSSTSTPRVYFGGRGGAGNIKPTYERAIFSFDEELERDRLFHEHQAPVYSIGRGGAGNIIASENTPTRYYPGAIPCSSPSSSSMASPRSSMSSAGGRSLVSSFGLRNSADRVWERLSRVRSPSSSSSSPRTSS